MQIYAKKTNEMLKFSFFNFFNLELLFRNIYKKGKKWDSSLRWFVKLGVSPIGVCLMYGREVKML